MRARIDYYCRPARISGGVEELEIHRFVDLPFAPSVGMLLKLTPRGDYLKVDDVMLDITPGGAGLIIGIEEPAESSSLRPLKEMEEEGWIVTD